MSNYFVITDLPDHSWSVSWPGYEYVVVNDTKKAINLLKILFDEIKVDEVQLAVHEYNKPDKEEIMHINWAAWAQDAEGAAKYVVDCHVIKACKFPKQEQAQLFKLIMEKRLAWRRLSGQSWK